jgi:hypothetical protein
MSIVIQSRSGADSKLHQEIPVDRADAEFEVEVVIRPKPVAGGWPPGYAAVFGSIDDDTFTVHSQPPLPQVAFE